MKIGILKLALAGVLTTVVFATVSSGAMANSKHAGLQNSQVAHASSGQSILPPFAYIQYCVHHRGACSKSIGHVAMVSNNTVKLTPKLSRQMATINASVNASMIARSDKGSDTWSVGGRYGDCEDYAMTKRAKLIAAGWPSAALSLTVVKTPWGEGHAVLSVHTSEGLLVLDNLTHSVKPLYSAGYRVVSVQGNDPLLWHKLAGSL